jgi:hypothetical protein
LTGETDLLIFDAYSVTEGGKTLKRLQGCKHDQFHNLWDYPELLLDNPAPWNKIFKKELFFDNNIFYTPKVWYEDIRTVLKIYPHAHYIQYVSEPLYFYVHRQGSTMNADNSTRNLEIIEAMDDLINYYKNQGYYSDFASQMEYLSFKHQFIAATVRVNKINKDSAIQDCLRKNFMNKFPDYGRNPYVIKCPLPEKIAHMLIYNRHYSLLHFIFMINDMRKR